jgi:hypothetical protein
MSHWASKFIQQRQQVLELSIVFNKVRMFTVASYGSRAHCCSSASLKSLVVCLFVYWFVGELGRTPTTSILLDSEEHF